MSVQMITAEELGHLASFLTKACGYAPTTMDLLAGELSRANARTYSARYARPMDGYPTHVEIAAGRRTVRGEVSALQALRLMRKLVANCAPRGLDAFEVEVMVEVMAIVCEAFPDEGPSAALRRLCRRITALRARPLRERTLGLLMRRFRKVSRRVTADQPRTALAPTW